jgi:hypothetical protein
MNILKENIQQQPTLIAQQVITFKSAPLTNSEINFKMPTFHTESCGFHCINKKQFYTALPWKFI